MESRCLVVQLDESSWEAIASLIVIQLHSHSEYPLQRFWGSELQRPGINLSLLTVNVATAENCSTDFFIFISPIIHALKYPCHFSYQLWDAAQNELTRLAPTNCSSQTLFKRQHADPDKRENPASSSFFFMWSNKIAATSSTAHETCSAAFHM